MKKIMSFILILILIFTLSSCGETYYECTPINVFDTIVTMVFYDEPNYKTHYDVIKKEFNKINRLSNDFNTSSDGISVYDLNQNRTLESKELADMISKAIELKNETNGYFNPFIGRLTHEWKNAFNDNKVLDNNKITEELNIMNNTNAIIDGNRITLEGEGNIDLGAFAKGYALEWAKNYLNENNITKYYINCGSSSIYVGDKELSVALAKPYSSGNILEFNKSNIGIATSSPKYQYKEINGIKYHHLINPFNGMPSNIYDSVNIIGENNLINDVYSTACFNMELDVLKEFIHDKNINVVLFKDNEIIYQKEEI